MDYNLHFPKYGITILIFFSILNQKHYKENVATVQEMDPTWITTVLLVPCVVVLTAGLFYLYGAVIGLLSKTSVRNKVVVITDALSGLGKGNVTASKEPFLQWPHVCDL